ncbi:LuxR C-terminal-related transcriptional regulator [Pseudomonas sp. GCM10022188]|uniref:LuxR C-terminal-related transcriptional regulator n=1 Tax=Pseudomonas TaxID=286 RepID=UPI001E35A780|nr:LuxR C-terminal-related transcriptional regulator [Pseudomonas oryzagri]MCC6075907.1 LuxR C-terminal-related transcriptional regulator [Pseudomonas oryzagri]
MASPLVNPSQLRPLSLPDKLLARPRLLNHLQDAAARGCRLILVSAPLGYGKSTLLAQYAAGLQTPWAWYRLDRADNQTLHLLLHLHAALGLPAPEQLLTQADEPRLWGAILQRLEHQSDGFTLILDDLHQLRAERARHYLEQLLRFGPPGLLLLAACEGAPELAINHLRRDERLAIVDARELAVDSEEISQLAVSRGARLDSDALYQLRAGSEGWITGLQFWFTAYREQIPASPQPELIRSVTRQAYGYVADFLAEEVLARLPAESLDFLERTSVVQTFDPALANLLGGRADGERLIRQLQRRDLFIEQRPGERLEYRYHRVLREVLYQRLQERDPQLLQRLHQQAAAWLLEQRRYSEAIYQYGRARDFNAVLATAERHTFDLLRDGQINALVDLLSQVSGESGSDHFTLAISEASIVMVTNDIARTTACIQRLRLLQRQGVPRNPERVQQTIAYLRVLLALLGGNLRHGHELAGQALQRYSQRNAAGSVLRFNRSRCLFHLGQLAAARQDVEQALGELDEFGFSGFANIPHLLLGQIELAQGDSVAAMRRFLALERKSPATASRNFYELFHHLGLGLVFLQQNHLEQARQRLVKAETLALGFPHSAALVRVLHHQACLYDALGEPGKAMARWDEARRLARQFRQYALYRLAGAWRARLAVRERDQDFILAWLQEWHWCQRTYGEDLLPDEWLAYAWVQRHLGQPAMARQILANLREQADAEHNRRLQLDLWLLDAALQRDRGEQGAALACLDEALQLAAAHGFGQLLHHEGRELAELFRLLLQPQARRQAGLERPLPPREQLASLLVGLAGSASGEGAAQALLEPLTRRELDVLRRMARGQNNQQLADGLFVSLSTVKTHINNLFRKLDVTDRDAALRAARELRLLD